MKKTLSYEQVNQACNLLGMGEEGRDPDDFPSELLPHILVNREALRPIRKEWRMKLKKILIPHVERGEDGPIEVDEDDPDATGIEKSVGVMVDDPEAVEEQVAEKLSEKVDVELSTVPLDLIQKMVGEDDLDALGRWHFMIET